MKILFVASNGGHLAQLLPLKSWWQEHNRHWVTFRGADSEAALAGEDVIWAFHPTTRNIPNAVRNLCLAVPTLRRLAPDVVCSVGAGVAVPFFIAAKLLGIRTVFLESIDRITMPTLTGRLCYPLADVFCVQWDKQRNLYAEAVNIGPVL